MKRPAVFFDRDNTLIATDGYLGDPTKVVLVDGAADAVARARSLGFAVVVFSNQSGVARGLFSEEDVHRVNARLDELLQDQNPHAVIDRHEFCPFHPEGTVPEYARESDLCKPKPGMILQAAEKLALDLGRSWAVGDAPRDIEAGKAAGCRTVWFKDPKLPPSMAARELMLSVPDAIVTTLKEAIDVIARDALTRQPANLEAAPRPVPQPAAKAPAAPAPRATEPDEDAEPDAESAPASEPRRAGGPRAVTTAKPLVEILAQKRAARANAATAVSSPDVPAAPQANFGRLEELAEQILQELQRREHSHEHEFSISKLMAGIMQILAVAIPLLAYFLYHAPAQIAIETGTFLQAFTIALLIMGRQR